MPEITREQLWSQLRAGEVAPAYLLFGNEPFLRDKAAKFVADRALNGAALREFNESEVSLNQADSLADVLAAAEQLPMMAERRVIRIVDVRISATGNRDNLREESETVLRSYLERPAPTTVLIFVADDCDKRRRMAKLLLDKTSSVEFKKLDETELANWARREITNLGFDIDSRALHYFVGLVGDNLRRLDSEIKKVTTAALPDKVITFDLVDSIVPSSRILENFDLTDHLFGKDKARTFEILKKMLDDGAEPLMLLGLIASNLHRVLKAKELMKNGVERREVAKIVGLPYRKQEDFLALARRTDATTLINAIRRLNEADLSIKTSRAGGGPVGNRLQIELLIAELIHI